MNLLLVLQWRLPQSTLLTFTTHSSKLKNLPIAQSNVHERRRRRSVITSIPSKFTQLALALTLLSFPLPSQAIPFPSQTSPNLPPLSATPFSQSQNLETGLENGKIRACPAVNPGCVTTSPKSSSSSLMLPWVIPQKDLNNPLQRIEDALMRTQKNVLIRVRELDTGGRGDQYLEAEMDGGGGGIGSRDVVEFLVKKDVVAYRAMATKVVYVYPFTSAFGDSKGQQQRLQSICEELGWEHQTRSKVQNQDMQTPSWYPSPLGYPPSPSASSDVSSVHSRNSDHPQSPFGKVAPAEAAGIIAVLKDKSVNELKNLLERKEAYNDALNSVEEVTDQNKLRNDLLEGTIQLARDNLEKETCMEQLRTQCTIITTSELAHAHEKLNDLKMRRDNILQLFSPSILVNRLRDAMTSTDNESEALHKQFLAGDLDLQSFSMKYKKLRTDHHRCTLVHISARTSVS